MGTRLLLLALALVALAAGAVRVAWGLAGKPDELEMALLWVLPAAVFLCGLLILRRQSVRSERPGLVRRFPWIAVAIALDLAPIGVALALGWVTIVTREGGGRSSKAVLWMLPLLIVVAVRFWERTVRGWLFAGALEQFGSRAAWAVSLLCGTALAAPLLVSSRTAVVWPFLLTGFLVAAAREAGCTALFRGSGVLASGLYRGLLVAADALLWSDWLSPLHAGTTYIVASDTFYLLRAAAALGGAGLLLTLQFRCRSMPGAEIA